jgi:hypothetical protein
MTWGGGVKTIYFSIEYDIHIRYLSSQLPSCLHRGMHEGRMYR